MLLEVRRSVVVVLRLGSHAERELASVRPGVAARNTTVQGGDEVRALGTRECIRYKRIK